MAEERWVKLMLCAEGDAKANTIVDGVCWITPTKWAKIRDDKRIKKVPGPPKFLHGVEYKRVEDVEPKA